MTRAAIAAGSFYEASSESLDKQIKDSFLHAQGPGELQINKRKGKILGAIVPHAGYMFSGPCAAWAYKEIGEAEFADIYIILGTSHSGLGTAVSMENYETPFGVARVDQGFAKEFMKKSGIKVDEKAHSHEHSIEVQLPMLQFVCKELSEKLKILPIVVSHDTDYRKLGLDIKETIIDSGKKVCIIASSDFTHYGRNYHYLPFTSDVKKRLYELDGKALGFIKNTDAEGFLNLVYETGATICGAMPIAVLLNSIKAKKVELLQYYTSGDILGDYKNAVGYASVVFR